MPAIVWVSTMPQRAQKRRTSSRRGFTLIDVLVSLAIIAVLIGLMLPALSSIRETSRKVVCSSNIRQIGLSTAMYADDYRGQLPYSRYYQKSLPSYVGPSDFAPDRLMMARLGFPDNKWDGLGLLFGRQYCSAAQVYYCPSHKAQHRYETYVDGWNGAPINVFTNFQYRGGTSDGVNNFNNMSSRIALVADGLASDYDFNHAVGGNIVASDLSISWFEDAGHALRLPDAYTDPQAKDKLQSAWTLIDFTLFK